MEIREFKTTNVKKAYLKPKISFVALEDACMVFTSLQTHQTEPIVPIEEEGGDGVTIPDRPKGAKSFDAWEDDVPDNDVDFSFRFNSND